MNRQFVFGFVLMSLALSLHGAPASVSTTVSVRVLEDTNLYLQDGGALAAGQTQPAQVPRQRATALDAAVSCGVTGTTAEKTTWELGYAPEVFRYFGPTAENHVDHILTGVSSYRLADWVGEVKARYLYTDGAEVAPIFNGLGGGPAIGGEPVRARRSQAIGRASGKLAEDMGTGFVRGVFSIYDQNYHLQQRDAAGYCNYADRDESAVGIEAGSRALGPVALVAGVRVGEQRQADVLGVPLNYSNTFTRWLVGAEGALAPTLKVALLAGPDIRHFGHSVRTGFAREQRTGYGEGSATWTPSAAETVTFAGKNYLWYGGTGRGIYTDTVVDLNWKHRFAADWTGHLGANYHDGTTGRFMSTGTFHDHIYTETIGVTHALPKRTRVEFDVMHDEGVSLIPNRPGRDFGRWITGVTVARVW